MFDPISRLNAALEGRYRIERELGAGGMATVYLAADLKHERKVALKVLKPDLARAIGHERFLAEIRTTAKLQHPGILALFDSGEADGDLFYVMPWVDGESLRDRLDREPQLPVDEAVRIAGEVSEALDYAHRQGVVHRDIKPANILMVEGRPVVADFGIALAADAVGQGRLTETGRSLGTPHYMSPEQASGDESVDARTDTYALGCVLYEMLVGEPPYTGRTPQAILGKIIKGEPRSAADERPVVPPNVDAAIRKSLERLPVDRFERATRFAEALTNTAFTHRAHHTNPRGAVAVPGSTSSRPRMPLLAAGAMVALLGAGWWATKSKVGPSGPLDPSVAVLPFEDLSPAGDQEFFAAGLSEEIQLALARLEGLTLTKTSSSFALDRRGLGTAEIAAQLAVANVLDGSVQRVGDRVRIRAFLVDAATGLELWSGSFDETTDDIFAIQDAISRAIADQLRLTLAGGSEAPIVVVGTESRAAHDAYLRGLYFFARNTPEDVDRAMGEYERAISLDSTYAEAWAGLARAAGFRVEMAASDDPLALRQRALEAAEKAVDLAPDLALARLARGRVLLEVGRWAEAEEDLEAALRLNPSRTHLESMFLRYTGRVEEAVLSAQEEVALDPVSARQRWELAWSLQGAGRAAEAIDAVREAIELEPDVPLYWELLGGLLLMADRPDESMAALYRWLELNGDDESLMLEMFDGIVRHRATGEAVDFDFPPVYPRNPGLSMSVYIMSGQREKAVAMAEILEQIGFVGVIARIHWLWQLPRDFHPRYEALLDRVGITW